MKHQWFELGFYRSQSGACLSIKGTDWNFKFHLVPFWVNKRNKMKPYQVEKALQMNHALMWQLPKKCVYEPVNLNIWLMWQNVSISSFLVSNSVFYFVKTLYCMAYIAFFMIKLYAIKGTKWNQQFQIGSFIYEKENKMKLIVSNRVFYRRKREQNETNGFIQGLLGW